MYALYTQAMYILYSMYTLVPGIGGDNLILLYTQTHYHGISTYIHINYTLYIVIIVMYIRIYWLLGNKMGGLFTDGEAFD